MAQLSRQQSDLKNRVITCLNKLSDRDTLSIATNELESIAKSLSNDAFAPFLSFLSATDSSDKSPVRRQCVRILGILSASHGDALSPHLSKILSSVLRRLRDPDSSVRSACVDAVSSIASHITRPPFSSISNPLIDCISHEQDYNAQIGASLCFAAAIEVAPEPDPPELRKHLPKLLKLAKNDCFKAKPALLSLIGSIGSVGGASSKNLLKSLVPMMVEFLSSDDWSARKAAAEKVKVVRESMNRAMELWKEVPGSSDEVSDETESKSSLKDFGCGEIEFATPPELKKTIPKIRSPTSNTSSSTSNPKRTPSKSDIGKPKAARFCQVDFKRSFDCKNEVALSQNSTSEAACQEQKSQNLEVSDSADSGSCKNTNLEAKSFPFNRNSDEKCRFSGLRFGARVVPLHGNEDYDSDPVNINATGMAGSQIELENLSLIQKQLHQIENQQSSLLDLLQRFIGHSQNGMNSLERRVNGLEKALDEMSNDLAISSRRVLDTDAAGNACCMLPGAEFLSPKFWRKSEGQNSCSKIPFPSRRQSLNCLPNKDVNSEISKLESPRSKHQSGGMSSLDITGYTRTDLSVTMESYSRTSKVLQGAESVQIRYAGDLGRTSNAACIQQQT